MYSIFYFIVVVSLSSTILSIDEKLIEQYFNYNHVNFINVYHCFNNKGIKFIFTPILLYGHPILIYWDIIPEEVNFLRKLGENFTWKSFNLNEIRIINTSDIFLKRNIKVGFWIDTINCNYTRTLKQLSNVQAFRGIHYFFLFMKDVETIKTTFENVLLTVNSNLKIMVEDDWVYDVYNPSTLHGGKLIVEPYRQWNVETRRFQRMNYEHLYSIRRNMTGITFQTMVVLPKHFPGTLEDYLFNDDHREENSFNRFHAVLMYHVRDYYNYNLNMSRTKSWGYLQPNGTFDGMVRAIELHQLDFGSSPLFVKDERWAVLDYGRRTWKLKSAFLFRTPKKPASFEVFLRPLDGQVWYLTVVACIVIVVLMKLSLRSEISLFKYPIENFEPAWSNIILFTFGAMCQQGCYTSPRGTSSRISFIFIFIFTVLLYQYYSASIVSILLMTPDRFIRTLHDLAFSTLILGCEDVLYNRDYINKLVNDTTVSQLSKNSPRGTDASFYVEPETGLSKVAAGGYAYHVELATAYPIIAKTFDEDAICSLDEIQLFQLQQMHQPVQKGSEFREMLDYVLHRIDETGLMYRQQKHWHARKPECIRSRPATSSVSIEEFYPALSMLLVGIMFSVFVFIVEHIMHIHQQKIKETRIIKELHINKHHGIITGMRH